MKEQYLWTSQCYHNRHYFKSEKWYCDQETAFACTISAKNCFINISGFTPHQIVLGRNINLLSIYNDQPSADLSQNKIIIDYLSVLHATTRAFVATELSKKLKTALQIKKTRQTREHFNHGSQVYYKWSWHQKSKRPGKVVGHNAAPLDIEDFLLKFMVHMYS